MYRLVFDAEADEQIDTLPYDALLPLAELFDVLTVTPWNGDSINESNPAAPLRAGIRPRWPRRLPHPRGSATCRCRSIGVGWLSFCCSEPLQGVRVSGRHLHPSDDHGVRGPAGRHGLFCGRSATAPAHDTSRAQPSWRRAARAVPPGPAPGGRRRSRVARGAQMVLRRVPTRVHTSRTSTAPRIEPSRPAGWRKPSEASLPKSR